MKAKFAGKCGCCSSKIAVGDEITYVKGKGVVGCTHCGQGASKPVGVSAPAAKSEAALPTPTAEEAIIASDALFARLDDYQKRIALWTPEVGNVRVVAGAGSGKTTTVVALISRLLHSRALDAGEIIATTFTSKAAKELRERLARVVPPGALDPSGGAAPGTLRVGTFHSLAIRALRSGPMAQWWSMDRCMDVGGRAAEIPGSSILWQRVIGFAGVDGLPGTGAPGLDLDPEEHDARTYALAVDVARSKGLTGVALAGELRRVGDESGMSLLGDAWELFSNVKKALAAWDFADALQAWHDHLASRNSGDARLVIVDEAQDNSAIQLSIARLLSRDGALMLVGDVRQSIYGWRGAHPEAYREADTTIGAVTMEAPTNYRSVNEIVSLGNRVANGKSWTLGSDSVAHRTDTGAVTVASYDDPASEAAAVAEEISAALAAGSSAADFAILTRTNALAGAYEAALVMRKIPCAITGPVSFFGRAAVKDFLAYVSLLVNDNDFEALTRAVRTPKRFLGKKFVESVKSYAGNGLLLPALDSAAVVLPSRQRQAAAEFRALIGKLRSLPWRREDKDDRRPTAAAQIAIILGASKENAKGGEADDDRSGIPAAVAEIAKQFATPIEFLAFAARCAGEVESTGEEAATSRVTISTIHKAKGLEWRVVYLSASRGSFPHARCSNTEEEERLFYVACTRARDELHLSSTDVDLRGNKAGPSPFLDYAEKTETEIEAEAASDAPRYDDEGFDQNGKPHPGYFEARKKLVRGSEND